MRIFLLPFAMAFELVIFGACCVLAWPFPSRAEWLANWVCKTLPGWGWYLGGDKEV